MSRKFKRMLVTFVASLALVFGVNAMPAHAVTNPVYTYTCTKDAGGANATDPLYTITYAPKFVPDPGISVYVVIEPQHAGTHPDLTSVYLTNTATGLSTDTGTFHASQFAGTQFATTGIVQLKGYLNIDGMTATNTMAPPDLPIDTTDPTTCPTVAPVLKTLDPLTVKTSPGRVVFTNPVTNPTVTVTTIDGVITIAPGKFGVVRTTSSIIDATVTATGYADQVIPGIHVPTKGKKVKV